MKPTPDMPLVATQEKGRYLIEVAPRADWVRMARVLDFNQLMTSTEYQQRKAALAPLG